MLDTFLATLTPMLTLLFCIAVGFALKKGNILPDGSDRVMAKLENWVFCPALAFMTMANNCKINTISEHATNIVLSCIVMCLALATAILLSRVFVKTDTPERGVYAYALMFGNFGYVGDPVVRALFGDLVFSYYKLYTLPLSILVYVWGISVLVPADKSNNEKSKAATVLKRIFTAPTIGLLLGILVGLTDTVEYFPEFIVNSLDNLKACMGPVAMLLAGFTIASYDLKGMLTKKKVYFATGLRLIVLPAIMIAALFGLKTLGNRLFGLDTNNNVLYYAFFSFATPLGLNTVVFPAAYGGDPETGAGMALISHTLCVLTIPLLFALMVLLFGPLTI